MEQGDATPKRRLKAFAENERIPYCFTDEDRLAWTFGLDEDHSRDQLNSLIIISKIGNAGGRSKITGSSILEAQD